MPTRTVPDPPQYDATVQRAPSSIKNPFEREPLLIPQLFVDPTPPWYRRRAVLGLILLVLVCVAPVAFAVHRVGWVGLFRAFVRIAPH